MEINLLNMSLGISISSPKLLPIHFLLLLELSSMGKILLFLYYWKHFSHYSIIITFLPCIPEHGTVFCSLTISHHNLAFPYWLFHSDLIYSVFLIPLRFCFHLLTLEPVSKYFLSSLSGSSEMVLVLMESM